MRDLRAAQFRLLDQRFSSLQNNTRSGKTRPLKTSLPTSLDRFALSFNQALEYSIFEKGRSALRDLPDQVRNKVFRDRLISTEDTVQIQKVIQALRLLQTGYLDAAHEVVLGVTPENLEQAEYAGSNRGKTNWNQEHPLDEMDDFLHSILHRMEGARVGEGGYTGYENAQYWAAGGPKLLPTIPTQHHPVYQALIHLARQHLPSIVSRYNLIPSSETSHVIIAGGGKTRNVTVDADSWDLVALAEVWKIAWPLRNRRFPLRWLFPSTLQTINAIESLFQWEVALLQAYEESRRTLSADDLLELVSRTCLNQNQTKVE